MTQASTPEEQVEQTVIAPEIVADGQTSPMS